MAGYIEKGKIATINGSAATVVPCNEADLVSASVVVPWYMRGASGNLQKGTEVIYAIFEDQTGILLGRADGNWGEYLPALTVNGKLTAGSAAVSGGLSAGSASVGSLNSSGGITADGDVTAGNVNTGNVTATGSISGGSVTGETVTAGGISLASHKHPVTEGATETGAPK